MLVPTTKLSLVLFIKTRQPNRPPYKMLVGKKQKKPVEAQRKWIADWRLETQDKDDWNTVYWSSLLCTKISKLIVFQFKLLHWRFATNSFKHFLPKWYRDSITSFGLVTYQLFFGQDFKQRAVNRGGLSNTINLMADRVVGLNLNKNNGLDFYFSFLFYVIMLSL